MPLPDGSFDIVFCDHGAMTFADPYRTVPEVARLLRPGLNDIGLAYSATPRQARPGEPGRNATVAVDWLALERTPGP